MIRSHVRMPARALLLIILFALFCAPGTCADGDKFIRLSLAGSPIREDLIKFYAIDAVLEALPENDRAEAIINPAKISCPVSMFPGQKIAVDVPVKLPRMNMSAKKDKYFLTVTDEKAPLLEEKHLIISNDPEEISEPSLLLTEPLDQGEAVRLVYYHKGSGKAPLYLNTYVKNNGDIPASVFISKAYGGPDSDEIFAGHVAVRRFLAQDKNGIGRILSLQPGASVKICGQMLSAGEVVSAVMKLGVISGSGLKVEILSEEKPDSGPSAQPGARTDEDGRLSGRVDMAEISINRDFICGTSFVDIRIGEEPALFPSKNKFDLHLGNYGLMHKVKISATNPMDVERTVALHYIAAGGPARGVFLVNGKLIETGLLDPQKNKSEKLFSFRMPPKTSGTINIAFMPQPGSYYPTRLVVMDEP